MGRDKFNNIAKLTNLLVKFHRVPSSWLCLQNRACRSDISPRRKIIKLVRSDGSLEIYDRPMEVSELMRDFPKHMVCRSDSLYIGQRTPVLSESDRLQPGHNYFLLPSHFFQNVLSFVSIAALNKNPQNGGVLVRTQRASRNHRQPFHIQKASNGSLRIRVSEDFLSELMMERGKTLEDEEDVRNSRVCTTAQLQKDYVQLVGSRKWTPKLETIKETKTKTTRTRVSGFLVMKRRNKESRALKPENDYTAKPRRLQSKSKSKYRFRKPICRK